MTTNLKRKSSEDYTGENSRKKIGVSDQNIDEKISNLINKVVSQGLLGRLVIILQSEGESPYVTLQNSVAYLNLPLTVVRNESSNNFELHINGQEFSKGVFQNIQIAKKPLAEETLEKLKEMCFFITKKNNYVNVTKDNLQEAVGGEKMHPQVSVGQDSIAHRMMMKMGWTGGGLGAQEQGNLDSVELYENVNRQGLGHHNLMKHIHKKLQDFSKSTNLLTLVFDEDFTKEERIQIHKAARKYNLKSKSTGSESRRLQIMKKLTRLDIVKELLRLGGEDGLYKLHIPTKFAHLWN